MSVFLAFLAAICWGAADFLGGMQSKRFHFALVTLCREIAAVVAFALLIAFTSSQFRWSDVAMGLGVGVIAGFALPVFFGALASGRMSLVAPVAGSVGASVPIIVGVASGERPSLLQFLGLGLAVLAIAFVSVEHIDDGVDGTRRHFAIRDIAVAALCGTAFGIFYVAMHHTSEASGFWPVSAVSVGVGITVIIWSLFAHDRSMLHGFGKQAFRACAVGGLLEALAATLYVMATRKGLLSITAGVSSLYPVGTALLAGYLLKEKFTRVNATGLAMCAAGLTFIAV
jgi:uncharacterized membrane protein